MFKIDESYLTDPDIIVGKTADALYALSDLIQYSAEIEFDERHRNGISVLMDALVNGLDGVLPAVSKMTQAANIARAAAMEQARRQGQTGAPVPKLTEEGDGEGAGQQRRSRQARA